MEFLTLRVTPPAHPVLVAMDGAQIRPKWSSAVEGPPVLCCVVIFFSLIRHPGPVWAPFWQILAPLLVNFVTISDLFAQSWYWMGWWGYAKRQEF